jgi:hypothetical protein
LRFVKGNSTEGVQPQRHFVSEIWLPARGESAACTNPKRLVVAAVMKHRENHEVRMGVIPFRNLRSGCFGGVGGALQNTYFPEARHVPQMLDTNPRESGNFFFGKELLAGPDGNRIHGDSTYRHVWCDNEC